jgi:lipopolysaccharide/colanic/teichoic acid biosynthesis glycosyltransferase
MSFAGSRPALFNQDDLIALRTKKGMDKLLPGITGWAQVNGFLCNPDTLEGVVKKSFAYKNYNSLKVNPSLKTKTFENNYVSNR